MNTEQLFQEVPKDTESCTLVTDTPDTQKVRNDIKTLITTKLKPKPIDYDIVETPDSYKITQRFTPKPAVMVVRLRSHKKSMKLFAYNAFEIYHGGCKIVNMKVENNIDAKKLEKHVHNAIDTFKEQADFSKHLIKKYRDENKEQVKKEKALNRKTQGVFGKVGIVADKEGMVTAFGYRSDEAIKLQLFEVARCSYIIFSNTKDLPTSALDDCEGTIFLSANYKHQSDSWDWKVYATKEHRNVALKFFNTYIKKGIKIDKKIQYPNIAMEHEHRTSNWYGARELSDDVKYGVEFGMSMPTLEFAKILHQLGLKVWKIKKD